MSEQESPHSINFEKKNQPEFLIFHNIEKVVRHRTNLLSWPLHITIVPPFQLENGSDDIMKLRNLLRDITDDTPPFMVSQTEEALFGPSENVPVTKLDSKELNNLHHRFLWDLGSIGCNQIDMTYAGENYSPHFTWKKNVFPPLKTFTCDSLSIAMRESGTKQMIDTQLLRH